MIIYIHGFGSCGKGLKADILKKSFENENFISPSLSYVPDLAIDTLIQLIESFKRYEEVSLIGSSLGGFYSIYLANLFKIKAVLINPAINPEITLDKIGLSKNYYDNSSFETTKEHLEMLKKYKLNTIDPKLYMLLAKKGDEVLDYKEAAQMFKDSNHIIENGGDHTFGDISKHLKNIKSFLNTSGTKKYKDCV